VNLPNGARALVDLVKLREYVLSQTHPRGRHNARVFLSAFGLTAADAEELQRALLEAAQMRRRWAKQTNSEDGIRLISNLCSRTSEVVYGVCGLFAPMTMRHD